jgi:hypothetical protein
LDLDERANLRFVANFATIEVDELGKLDVPAQLHVWSDALVRVHEWNNSRSAGWY